MLPRNWNAPRWRNSLRKTFLELPCYRCWASAILTLKKIEQESIDKKDFRLSCCSGTNATASWLSPTVITAYARSTHLMKMPSSHARLSDQVVIVQVLRERIMHSERTESTTQ